MQHWGYARSGARTKQRVGCNLQLILQTICRWGLDAAKGLRQDSGQAEAASRLVTSRYIDLITQEAEAFSTCGTSPAW